MRSTRFEQRDEARIPNLLPNSPGEERIEVVSLEDFVVTTFSTPGIPQRDVDGLSLLLPDRFEIESSLMVRTNPVLDDDVVLAKTVLFPCSEEQLHLSVQKLHRRVRLGRRTGQADKVTGIKPGY